MAKEQGKEKRIHPLNWRDALVRWGGWGGEAEVSVTRFFSQRVYFIMLWGTIWRNMTIVSMIMLRHKSIIAGAVACLNISQIRSLLPMLLLLPPLRMFDSSNCVYWGTLSMLWRLISKAEVAFGFVPPIIILKRMQQTHVDIILDVLYYPLIEPTMNMPLALLIHLISIPIDANIGLRTGAQTDYLTATVVNMLALVVRILWAVHQRRQFIRQHALLMLAEVDEVASSLANEHLLVPIHGGSMSTMTTTITAGSVGDNEEEKLPEYRSGCSIMAGSVGDNKEETLPEYESGSSDTEYDDPLRGLEHMMVDGKDEYKDDNDLAIGCVPELTEAQAPENFRVLGTTASPLELGANVYGQVTVYIPWSDPADLGANAITNVTSKLQELLPDFRVLRTTVRKGSLILTFDLIYVGATPELDPLECIQSTVPTQSWVQWLDLPWPKDGEKVMVQVGDQHTGGVTWDLNAQCWVVGKVSAVGATLHPVKITSVEPQVLYFPKSMDPIQLNIGVKAEVLSFPKSMEPVQLNIGVKSEVSRKLLNPSSDMQLRARYMKRAVPLYLHPIEDQLETEGKLGYTPAAFADRVNLTREAKPSPKARGRDSLEQGIVRCASPLSSGMPRATSLSRAPQAAASVAKGVVPAIDNMHTAKGVVPATDSMQTDLGGVPWVTSLSCAPQAGASLHIEKRVVPATDSMHVEKGGVPATDSMHVEKGVVPKTDSMHIEKRVVPATDSMHVEKGVVPATNSMHVEKGVVPATDSMHVDKGRVPAMDTMHIEKGLVPATGSMHVKKGRVPAHEADPCPPPYTRISSGTDFMDSDATVAMSKILEERRTCSAFEEKALDEVVLKRKGELAKAGAAELNSKLKSSSVRETVKSLVSRLGLKLKKGASLLAVCTKSP
eukprot:gene7399-526_t